MAVLASQQRQMKNSQRPKSPPSLSRIHSTSQAMRPSSVLHIFQTAASPVTQYTVLQAILQEKEALRGTETGLVRSPMLQEKKSSLGEIVNTQASRASAASLDRTVNVEGTEEGAITHLAIRAHMPTHRLFHKMVSTTPRPLTQRSHALASRHSHSR